MSRLMLRYYAIKDGFDSRARKELMRLHELGPGGTSDPKLMRNSETYGLMHAKYYGVVHSDKEYSGESIFVKGAVSEHKKSAGMELLDIACGTGGHAKFLLDNFSVVGMDLSCHMVKIAKEHFPSAQFFTGDMRGFSIPQHLPQKFDVITCLFSAISYNTTYEDLMHTFKNFYWHQKKGGVLIFDCKYTAECIGQLNEKQVTAHPKKGIVDGAKIVAVWHYKLDIIQKKIIYAHHLYRISTGCKAKDHEETHKLGIFSIAEIKRRLGSIGYDVNVYENFILRKWDESHFGARPVFVCVKK